jgi:DNA-binding transcriptional LysR family regulator
MELYEALDGHVTFTPDGQQVLEMAAGLFDRLREFERKLMEPPEVVGSVTVAAQDPVQLYLLPEVVARFKYVTAALGRLLPLLGVTEV